MNPLKIILILPLLAGVIFALVYMSYVQMVVTISKEEFNPTQSELRRAKLFCCILWVWIVSMFLAFAR